jgi:predicted DNA-binding transcriptional regulator AlpA
MADETLINEEAAAKVLQIHKVTLATWRHEGRGPTYIKIGKNIRYRPSEIESYLEQRTVRPAS